MKFSSCQHVRHTHTHIHTYLGAHSKFICPAEHMSLNVFECEIFLQLWHACVAFMRLGKGECITMHENMQNDGKIKKKQQQQQL